MSTAVANTSVAAMPLAAEARVLFLADHLGLPSGCVHGVTTYLLDVLPALRRTGIDVGACFLRTSHPAAETLRANGVAVHFLGTRRFNPFVVHRVGALVHSGGYRVLHCTQFRASIVGRALARADQNLRAVLHIHDLNVPPSPVRALNRIVASPADLGLCVSEAARDIAVRCYHVAPDRVRVLHTGIDTKVFRPLERVERDAVRRELGIGLEAPTLCLVGRFHRVKGQLEMIRMLAVLAARRPGCVLLLVGDGPMRPVCESLARELKLTANVRFAGQRNDVARLLGAADLAVVPSKSEGLCRAAIEANLCGLPTVAYDAGGLVEALPDRRCGELVPTGDELLFLAAIERALDAPTSAAHVDERVLAARRRFGLVEHVRALRACYETLDR